LKRTHILAPAVVDKKNASLIQARWMSRIHPVYAMIFSFLSTPITLANLTKELSYFLDISKTEAKNLIKPFINNNEVCMTNYDGAINYFPRNIIIDEDLSFTKEVNYNPEQFTYKELDLQRERFYIAPSSILFMVNNICLTDCVYCYADKSVKTIPLSFDRIKEIIVEAHKLGIAVFTIVGGEILLYKRWKELLDLLIEYNYRESLISTKVPLKEDDIVRLKTYDIPVQISLDAFDADLLKQILNVKSDYAKKMRQTICLLDKHGVEFQVATVLTTYNESIENLKALHNFLIQFKNLRRWEIRVGFKSLYSRGDFDKIKLSRAAINKIDEWVKELKQTTTINILWSTDDGEKYFKAEGGSRKFKGARCSANYSNMVILPDGKVTICEQLYWDPRFIIGDLTTQSIAEVWNSPKAVALSFPKREDFRDESACKGCDIFDECMSFPNKCFADVLKGYGKENWDYPDPRCIKAPEFTHDLCHK
jgi:radical SAM protein with 4Fe4S-binding SPASM domain